MPHLVTIARRTGAAYLGLALTGLVGHLVLTPRVIVPGDPAATLARLQDAPLLAQLALITELLIVLTQALAAWGFFALFFGRWLVPMGVFALSTGRMPRVLGWALIVGGIGYGLGALLVVVPALAPLGEALALLATVGELWIVGYLLSVGIRPARATA